MYLAELVLAEQKKGKLKRYECQYQCFIYICDMYRNVSKIVYVCVQEVDNI